jgi:hypothetical protein
MVIVDIPKLYIEQAPPSTIPFAISAPFWSHILGSLTIKLFLADDQRFFRRLRHW